MKNLYNKISQQEKKRILEMHTGMKKTIKEQYDDRNGMNWVQNTTMDRQRPMDEPMFEEGSFESILKKHNLLDKVNSPTKEKRLFMRRQSSKVVQKLLSILHLFDTVVFLAILDCESADFSDVDICGLPNLTFINLQGTENNFDEQGYECLENEGNGVYFHKEG
jgi:hypothetical protein